MKTLEDKEFDTSRLSYLLSYLSIADLVALQSYIGKHESEISKLIANNSRTEFSLFYDIIKLIIEKRIKQAYNYLVNNA